MPKINETSAATESQEELPVPCRGKCSGCGSWVDERGRCDC